MSTLDSKICDQSACKNTVAGRKIYQNYQCIHDYQVSVSLEPQRTLYPKIYKQQKAYRKETEFLSKGGTDDDWIFYSKQTCFVG